MRKPLRMYVHQLFDIFFSHKEKERRKSRRELFSQLLSIPNDRWLVTLERLAEDIWAPYFQTNLGDKKICIHQNYWGRHPYFGHPKVFFTTLEFEPRKSPLEEDEGFINGKIRYDFTAVRTIDAYCDSFCASDLKMLYRPCSYLDSLYKRLKKTHRRELGIIANSPLSVF